MRISGPPVIDKQERTMPRGAALWIHVILAIAFVVAILQQSVTLSRPFNYQHAWGVAGAVIEARAFRSEGLLHLRVVPIQNNPPFGLHPEAYVHWPPLLAVALTWWYDRFDVSETSTHAFTLVVFVLASALLYWMLAALLSPPAAPIGILAWIALPVTLKYSHVVLNETTELPFIALSVVAFVHATTQERARFSWIIVGGCATALAVLSGWEAALVPVGLMLGAILLRDRAQRRVAGVFLGCAAVVVVGVFGWYGIAYPDLALETFHTLVYRAGLSDTYSANPLQNLERFMPPLSPSAVIRLELGHLVRMIGALGLIVFVAFCATLAERWREESTNHQLITVSCGFIFLPLFWCTIFAKHVAIHEFEVFLLAPAVLIAIGWSAVRLMRFLATTPAPAVRVRFWTLVLVGPIVLLMPVLQRFHSTVSVQRVRGRILPIMAPRPEIMEADEWVEFGRAIRAQTVEGSVVVTPEIHRVPMYYSMRHTFGGVISEEELHQALQIIRRDFPGCPIYLALFAKDRFRFAATLAVRSASDGSAPPYLILRLDP
jgi:4-amino-4-deoxy-L-arabinose transferase-like glycosyltransferase